jgi:hypothetical protein
VKLKRLAEIHAGYQFRGRVEHDPAGEIAVLQVKDLKGAGDGVADAQHVCRESLVRVKAEKNFSRFFVRPGDVLFLSRGHRVFATALADPPPETVVPNYFYIVRPLSETLLPAYLAWYINAPRAQAQLKLVHAGSHMPLVSQTDFAELEIAVPPLDVQRRIVALADLARQEERLMHELITAKHQLVETICSRAVRGMDQGKRK